MYSGGVELDIMRFVVDCVAKEMMGHNELQDSECKYMTSLQK